MIRLVIVKQTLDESTVSMPNSDQPISRKRIKKLKLIFELNFFKFNFN